MSLALLFHYLILNMFRMLIHPSSGACDLFVELFHELYCCVSMCVGVTLWFGWGGVVSVCRLKPAYGYQSCSGAVARCASYDAHLATAPQHIPTQHDMLPQHLVCKYELICEYCNITLARNKAPWWWSDKIETCRSVFKGVLKVFYVKLYVHLLVDKLKWFYENARCYSKIYCFCFVFCG